MKFCIRKGVIKSGTESNDEEKEQKKKKNGVKKRMTRTIPKPE